MGVGGTRTYTCRQGYPLGETAGIPELPRCLDARFLIQHGDRALVSRLRICVRITNSSHTCSSQLTQGTHHVKHHACLASLIEMQVVPHDNVEQVVRSKSPIAGRLDVIAGYEKFLLTIRSREDASLRIVSSIGKKLQSQKRMSGTAFSQVNLNRVRLPFSIFRAHHHKIQSKAADNTFFGETFAYLGSFPGDQQSVIGLGRKNTAQITLPGRPAQKLVMR